jgi:hypothetical protein
MVFLCLLWLLAVMPQAQSTAAVGRFELQVVDEQTQRGIPLVELTSVDDVTWITDSAGRVAIEEPQLWGQTLYLKIESSGYEFQKDGFGFSGVRIQPGPGQRQTIALRRTQPAERLYRVTGRDIYRDSRRLGYALPEQDPLGAGQVVGQDSVQTVAYQRQLHWFWGDTNRLSYPLGLYRTSGAVSPLPKPDTGVPEFLIPLQYFADEYGFSRSMVDVPGAEGVVWIHGVCTVLDDDHRERMVAQYSRRRGLSEPLEQGLLLWNDDRKLFEVLQVISLSESWRILSDHPIHVPADNTDYLMFGNPFPVVRVPAKLQSLLDRSAWQAWSCRDDSPEPESDSAAASASRPQRDADGRLIWKWRTSSPVTQADEHRWVQQGLMQPEECRFLPRDRTPGAADQSGAGSSVSAEDQRIVQLHSGTVRFNAHRRRWIMIATEQAWHRDSPSFLGEVYYSESDSPQGPFAQAVKIATHPGQSFYNPCHQDQFDQQGGQVIHFEGTYCNTFTKSPAKPRYNYNQLLYRLDLNHPSITQVFGASAARPADDVR